MTVTEGNKENLISFKFLYEEGTGKKCDPIQNLNRAIATAIILEIS